LGVIQTVGAIGPGSGFGTSSEEIGLELTVLALELLDVLFQGGDAAQGIAMATLPISDRLSQLEILAF
jgi:hypothetical protein